jgi:hypothetical protein
VQGGVHASILGGLEGIRSWDVEEIMIIVWAMRDL